MPRDSQSASRETVWTADGPAGGTITCDVISHRDGQDYEVVLKRDGEEFFRQRPLTAGGAHAVAWELKTKYLREGAAS